MPPSLYHSQVTQNVLTTLRRHLVGRGLERIYQTIRRLEILLRTILAALLKKNLERNGQGMFHNSENDRER